MGKFDFSKELALSLVLCATVLCATTAVTAPAQTFRTVHSFHNRDGAFPWAQLVQGDDGYFYGTTQNGGNPACASGCGTLFKVAPNGKLTAFYFNGTNGSDPFAGLVQAANGDFYGTTSSGGTGNGGGNCPTNCGTVFKITPSGKLTTLHNFNNTDGRTPLGTLLLATDGNFYGTTASGGLIGAGTLFQITPSGTLTTLHNFSNAGADGGLPSGAIIQATDGNLYGTTWTGGTGNFGTVFKSTPRGTLMTLHCFDSTHGALPYAGLVQAIDGDFYGTTEEGGTHNYGTVFKITARGTLTTLHSFLGGADGDTPISPLVQATDGNFYGTASYDGKFPNFGTVFQITSKGKLTTVHNFDSTDGSYPYAGLVQATNGGFYGSTFAGGSSRACRFACGTVFSLSVGLGPFVVTLPTSGKIGTAVRILGTNLTGATSVTFNRTAAKFTVVSKSEIKTKVPSGATTGTVRVLTTGSTLNSNVVFRVTN
jgi:uncharacterized repeat protein (TIGR03803 family)